MRYRHFILLLMCIKLLTYAIVSNGQSRENLTIFAASSLTDVFLEFETLYEEQYPDVDIIFNFAGSSTLTAQINAGAPADIFASANEMQMQTVIDDGYIEAEDVQIFATNQLVIAIPADNPAEINSLEDLARQGIFLSLAVPNVPIRVYTDQMLEQLNEIYGESYQERVLNNLVSEEANVRQVVARIALGEVDAGIVYRTDITGDMNEQLAIIPIDTDISPLATYPIAPLANSSQRTSVQSFLALVLSDEGQMILHRYGFCSPAIMGEETAPEVTPEATSEPINETEDDTTICE